MLKLQFAANNLADYRGENKNGDVFEFDMGHRSYDEYERNGDMDAEKPAQGISYCFCPHVAEGEVNQHGKYA
jgi:hypothetical protein